MSKTETIIGEVSVRAWGENEVDVSMLNHDGSATLTAAQAVDLSRALVKAAAEALGVSA